MSEMNYNLDRNNICNDYTSLKYVQCAETDDFGDSFFFEVECVKILINFRY